MIRPILLKGHERPLTQVKFNVEGDILFSVSKDQEASVWYSSNGERIGTLNGHKGTIWSIDVDQNTDYVITASADFTGKLWKAQTGECIYTWNFEAPAKRVEFNPESKKALFVTDEVMGQIGTIKIFPIDHLKDEQASTAELEIRNDKGVSARFTVAAWGYGGTTIVAGHANGEITKWDVKTGACLGRVKAHEMQVTDIQMAQDKTYFITSSKDKSAKLFDVDNLRLLKTYTSDAPLNTACITPVKDFVILGGGQDARDVTTTAAAEGKFEAKIHHKIFQDEIGRVKGHFGPLNYIAVHPQGTAYASGGEDGYIRLHHFPKSYFDFQYDVEKTAKAAKQQELERQKQEEEGTDEQAAVSASA
ncbi:hypothetical protein BRETT_004874 [Brettanomyces bruxellensis]|uniref:Eukaryotic translation initiation factor 3 subunit I n=1 Tax=Dekkera bruxellensis TaxID=5007 RepID=A0A871RCA6_DEKBR|nr:uncharacterized protein BRETT_004874 [Brettanomyces bruxellensis]QOU20221.1 hypothetical protein BRETT_004874 [Brettanomyces bruxellensis]